MKGRFSAILLLFILLSATVVIAGCTRPGDSNPTATPVPTPDNTTIISPGALLFDMSKFHEFEYDIFASDGKTSVRVGKLKAEYEIVPYGNISDARHMRETRIIGEGSGAVTTITDLYYKQSNNWIIGGHATTITANGTTEKEISEDDPAYWNADMATVSSNVEFYDHGIDPVAVEKGFFPGAKKYTSTDSGITLWMADGIPIPVKMGGASASSGTQITTTMELVSYS